MWAGMVLCLLGFKRTALPLLMVELLSLRFPCRDLDDDEEATGGFMTLPCCCCWWWWWW